MLAVSSANSRAALLAELPNWTIRLSHSPHLSVYPFTWPYNPDIVIGDPRSQLGCSEPANSLLPFS